MDGTFARLFLCVAILGAGWVSIGGPAAGETLPAAADPVAVSGSASGPEDPAELEAFFDGILPRMMADDHIPGAVLSVVKDGGLFLAKGYGYADLERGIPFRPDTSLVRIASITKLFTWTAVMQLAEQGRLDLSADVNAYLTDFRIPDTYPQPVTLLDLMNHTAGFEDRNIGQGARTPEAVPPLGEFLARHMPARVRPPGIVSAYSNYGADLAGYIVSRVSGLTYEEYVQERILDPLGMSRTTAREPVPENLRGDLAADYRYADGAYEPIPWYYDVAAPDGSILSTAEDMARFMIAHLQEGRFGGAQILRPDTAERMHRRSFTADPRMPGWAHGFEELLINGRRAITHTGGKDGFRSMLLLLPESNLGLFLSFNGAEDFSAVDEVDRAFFDRYFPAAAAAQPAGSSGPAAAEFAGWYKPAASAETTIEKLVALVESAEWTAVDDRTLEIDGRRWTEVEPMLYREAGGGRLLTFLAAERGEAVYAAIGVESFERVPWYESPDFTAAFLGGFIFLALTGLIGWPVQALVRRRAGGSRGSPPAAPRAARITAAAGCGTALVFLLVLGILFAAERSEFFFGVPAPVYLLMTLPVAVAGTAAAAAVWTALAWKDGYWSAGGRAHYSAVALALTGFVWFAHTWNLLGFRFG
jgi:CubicO group peptidase (beta-lactamase class C family)